jgi:plastocyanin domain-containing protein
VNVAVTKDGFAPSRFTVRKNIPVRLRFIRKVEVTCATDFVIFDYDIKRELPLNEPLIVEFTPEKAGTISFACGMNMQRGKIVVR